MSEEKSGARPDQTTGPVKPESPLCRLLELIAAAIAEQPLDRSPSKKGEAIDSKPPLPS